MFPFQAFKKRMEKDWDRYQVNEDEDAEEEEDEDEDEEDEDTPNEVMKITDANYDAKLERASILALQVTWPWCNACKGNKVLEEAARKKGKHKKLRFGQSDARENRKIRKLVGAKCPEPQQCQNHLYLASKASRLLTCNVLSFHLIIAWRIGIISRGSHLVERD